MEALGRELGSDWGRQITRWKAPWGSGLCLRNKTVRREVPGSDLRFEKHDPGPRMGDGAGDGASFLKPSLVPGAPISLLVGASPWVTSPLSHSASG